MILYMRRLPIRITLILALILGLGFGLAQLPQTLSAQTTVNNCGTCTDRNGCICPSTCNFTGLAQYSASCGGYKSGSAPSQPAPTIPRLSSCTQTCQSGVGCYCPSGCVTNTSTVIRSGQSCGQGGGQLDPGGSSGGGSQPAPAPAPTPAPTPPTVSCDQICTSGLGCYCGSGCVIPQGTLISSRGDLTCGGPAPNQRLKAELQATIDSLYQQIATETNCALISSYVNSIAELEGQCDETAQICADLVNYSRQQGNQYASKVQSCQVSRDCIVEGALSCRRVGLSSREFRCSPDSNGNLIWSATNNPNDSCGGSTNSNQPTSPARVDSNQSAAETLATLADQTCATTGESKCVFESGGQGSAGSYNQYYCIRQGTNWSRTGTCSADEAQASLRADINGSTLNKTSGEIVEFDSLSCDSSLIGACLMGARCIEIESGQFEWVMYANDQTCDTAGQSLFIESSDQVPNNMIFCPLNATSCSCQNQFDITQVRAISPGDSCSPSEAINQINFFDSQVYSEVKGASVVEGALNLLFQSDPNYWNNVMLNQECGNIGGTIVGDPLCNYILTNYQLNVAGSTNYLDRLEAATPLGTLVVSPLAAPLLPSGGATALYPYLATGTSFVTTRGQQLIQQAQNTLLYLGTQASITANQLGQAFGSTALGQRVFTTYANLVQKPSVQVAAEALEFYLGIPTSTFLNAPGMVASTGIGNQFISAYGNQVYRTLGISVLPDVEHVAINNLHLVTLDDELEQISQQLRQLSGKDNPNMVLLLSLGEQDALLRNKTQNYFEHFFPDVQVFYSADDAVRAYENGLITDFDILTIAAHGNSDGQMNLRMFHDMPIGGGPDSADAGIPVQGIATLLSNFGNLEDKVICTWSCYYGRALGKLDDEISKNNLSGYTLFGPQDLLGTYVNRTNEYKFYVSGINEVTGNEITTNKWFIIQNE